MTLLFTSYEKSAEKKGGSAVRGGSCAVVDQTAEQVAEIKTDFRQKFDELDALLGSKMESLRLCAMDEERAQAAMEEAQTRLDWLEGIRNRVNAVLDI